MVRRAYRAPGLLGRDIGQRPLHHVRLKGDGIEADREAEVGEQDFFRSWDPEDVGGTDIAVAEAGGVHAAQRLRQSECNGHDRKGRDGGAVLPLPQRLGAEVGQDQDRPGFGIRAFERQRAQDAGAGHAVGNLELVTEAVQHLGHGSTEQLLEDHRGTVRGSQRAQHAMRWPLMQY